MPLSILNKPLSLRDLPKLAGLAVGAIVLALILASIVDTVTGPVQGPRYCLEAVRRTQRDTTVSIVAARTTWTRVMADHWAVAVLLQPADLNEAPHTVVCDFVAKTYKFDHFDVYDGDKVDAFKGSTESILLPVQWLR